MTHRHEAKWNSEPLRSPATISRPRVSMPPRACDCHMHVFGHAEKYPGVPDARYTLPEGSLEQYLEVARILSLERVVVVQPSYYGNDTSCLEDALTRLGSRSRGVVFLPERSDGLDLDRLQALGVRGIRIDFVKADAQGQSTAEMIATLNAAAGIARKMNWHIELYSPGHVNLALLESLLDLDVDFSVNHFGYLSEDETDEDFERFLELTRNPRFWVKLTAPYRLGGDGRRVDRMAAELIAAAPDRVLWGTDWPHIPQGSRDSGELLAKLTEWCPDEVLRHRILVDNPARLYQFS